MKINFLQAFSFLLALSFGTPGRAQTDSADEIKKTEHAIVLDDFEDHSSLEKWSGTFSVSNKFPAHGKSCLELKASNGQSLWLETEKITKNWTGFDCLKFDIYNPSPEIHCGSIQIFDELGTDEQAEYKGQSYNGEKIFMNAGWNHYEFILPTAMVEQGDRFLALDRIRKLRFSFGAVGH